MSPDASTIAATSSASGVALTVETTTGGPRRSRRPATMNAPAPAAGEDSASDDESDEAAAPPSASTSSKRARAKGPVRRKTSHSVIERRRREKINERLIRLQNIVPTCREEALELLSEKMSKSAAARKGKGVDRGEMDKVIAEKMVCEKLCIISHTVDFLEELLRLTARYKEVFGGEPLPASPVSPPGSPGAPSRSHHADAHSLEAVAAPCTSDSNRDSRSRKGSDASSTMSALGGAEGGGSDKLSGTTPAPTTEPPKTFKRKRHWGSNRIPKSAKCCHEPSCADAADVIDGGGEGKEASSEAATLATHHHHHHHPIAEAEGEESDSDEELAFETSCPSPASGPRAPASGSSWCYPQGTASYPHRQAQPYGSGFDMGSLTSRPYQHGHNLSGPSLVDRRHLQTSIPSRDLRLPPVAQAPAHAHHHGAGCMRGIDVLATVCCAPAPHDVGSEVSASTSASPSTSPPAPPARHDALPTGPGIRSSLKLAPMRNQLVVQSRDRSLQPRSAFTLPPLKDFRPPTSPQAGVRQGRATSE